jgi:hypothetical protein
MTLFGDSNYYPYYNNNDPKPANWKQVVLIIVLLTLIFLAKLYLNDN